jgi:hypothetical protein
MDLFWHDLGHDQKGEYISARLLKIASPGLDLLARVLDRKRAVYASDCPGPL